MSRIETRRRIYASDGDYGYEVAPSSDIPGITEIIYFEAGEDISKNTARLTVGVSELRALIEALQSRLPEAEAEEVAK